jgi:hydrogenase maturation protease
MSSTGSFGSGGSARKPLVLVYGYGNPGRQDDGLGVALADQLEAWALTARRPWLTFDRNYQLNAEDALEASHHDIVVFLDASQDHGEPFRFAAIQSSPRVSFSTHSMSPESVLALCRDLCGAEPAGRLLTIRGYSWEPNEAMTAGAHRNLEAARAWLAPLLDSPSLLLTTRRP